MCAGSYKKSSDYAVLKVNLSPGGVGRSGFRLVVRCPLSNLAKYLATMMAKLE
jgi:hypothetical protein